METRLMPTEGDSIALARVLRDFRTLSKVRNQCARGRGRLWERPVLSRHPYHTRENPTKSVLYMLLGVREFVFTLIRELGANCERA